MNNVGIILMAGCSKRANLPYNKVFYQYLGKQLYEHSLIAFLDAPSIDKIILVINQADEEKIKADLLELDEDKVTYIIGGATRTESVKKALLVIDSNKVVIHDAARPLITPDDIERTITDLDTYDATTFYHDVIDTIKLVDDQIVTLDRSKLLAVTTPQGFNKSLFPVLLTNQNDYLDDISIIEKDQNVKIGFLFESHANPKFTKEIDFFCPDYLVGQSYDFHQLVPNRKLILAGIEFEYPLGLLGHSDADVVYHAVTEAIIGALGLGDIGDLFPDNDPKYKDISSSYFLQKARCYLLNAGYTVKNLDVIIYIEEPKLKEHKRKMAENIANTLCISPSVVNVKATTMEKKGPIGSKEGIASEAIVLLEKTNKQK